MPKSAPQVIFIYHTVHFCLCDSNQIGWVRVSGANERWSYEHPDQPRQPGPWGRNVYLRGEEIEMHMRRQMKLGVRDYVYHIGEMMERNCSSRKEVRNLYPSFTVSFLDFVKISPANHESIDSLIIWGRSDLTHTTLNVTKTH